MAYVYKEKDEANLQQEKGGRSVWVTICGGGMAKYRTNHKNRYKNREDTGLKEETEGKKTQESK